MSLNRNLLFAVLMLTPLGCAGSTGDTPVTASLQQPHRESISEPNAASTAKPEQLVPGDHCLLATQPGLNLADSKKRQTIWLAGRVVATDGRTIILADAVCVATRPTGIQVVCKLPYASRLMKNANPRFNTIPVIGQLSVTNDSIQEVFTVPSAS